LTKKFLLVPLSLGILLLLIFFIDVQPSRPVLQVWNTETAQLVEQIDVKTGEMIGIKFIHSYDKGPVWEYFIIQEDGSFLLHEVAYNVASYDARDQTFPKATRELLDGIAYLRDIDSLYTVVQPEFQLRVPYSVPQWVLLNDQELELADWASPGTLLTIKISEEGGSSSDPK
jgi:hypothetical protein